MSTIKSSTTTTTAYQVVADTTGALVIQTGSTPTTAVTVDASQNVGIGVTPSAWDTSIFTTMQIRYASFFSGVTSPGDTWVGQNLYYGSGAYRYIANGYASYYRQSQSQHQWGVAASGTAGNAITFTQAMTLDASGNLLVGTTNNSLTAGAGNKFTYDGTDGGIAVVGATSTSANVTYRLYSTGAAAYRFYVGYNGTISATNTTITSLSDQRMKENIRDLDDGLNSIMALKPRKFDWKEGKGKGITNDRGFIAQEFETVFPDMIEHWLDPAPEGEEPYKAVNANLIPTLVKAIQEQQTIIKTLTDRITALESK